MVTISGERLTGIEVMRAAIHALPQNYNTNDFTSEIYCRAIGETFDSTYFDVESISTGYFNGGYGNRDSPRLVRNQLELGN